ncbi:MAG: aminotransferase class I/II-fold pyridoxal phosphate-dependent enzyme [Solobacterium sp.]|nr:aminotransferase class I/II-fold pyridoxal phosphate-dependent enzyme [Solobacterium sp.]
MKLPDFKTEQWMNVHEGNAVYNLTDSCVMPLTFQQLLSMDRDHDLDDVRMDYGTITGDPRLKKEILKMYRSAAEDNITFGQGCLQCSEMVMYTLLSPGDTVVTYTPSYQQFTDIPASIGCSVIQLKLYEEQGWQPLVSELEEVMQKPVRMVIINQPNNPTGSVFERAYLDRLISLCRKQGTWILCDEVYRGLYEEEISLSDLYEKCVCTSGLSKLYSLAGLRLGWIRGPREVIDLVNVRRDYSIISTGALTDTLALVALKNREKIIQRSLDIIEGCRREITEWLKHEARVSLVMPKYGTVSFPKYESRLSSSELAEGIQQKYGVFFVPGSCFDCEKHLRLTMTCPADTMREGLRLLSRYLDEADNS